MSYKKNILIVIASLKHGGGAEKVASVLGTKLVEDGYQVQYLTFYDAEKKYDFKGEEICLQEKPSKNPLINLWKLFGRAYRIKKLCKQNNIDTSISFMEESNFSNILSKFLRNQAKVIISIRQSIKTNPTTYQVLIRLLYHLSDLIVVLVKEEKNNLIKNYNIKEKKIVVIRNTINYKRIKSFQDKEIKEKYQSIFEKNFFTFINIGRLTQQKGQASLIKAFQKFQKKYNKTQLLILGEGEIRKNLEDLIKDNQSIYLLGNQKNPYQFLHQSDCFILSSRHEGMPNALLEGMALGLPVVSTDCPTGPKEILWDTLESFAPVSKMTPADYGILVPIDDEQSLCEAMEQIYGDEQLRKKYAQQSLIRAQDFSVEKIMELWKEAL